MLFLYIYFIIFIYILKWWFILRKLLYFDDSTKLLIKEIEKCDLLSEKEEKTLFKKYKMSKSSIEKENIKTIILKSNFRFIWRMSAEYHKITGIPVVDFFSEGKIGLLESFYDFDSTANIKFISWAVWKIRQRMSTLVSTNDLVYIPTVVRKNAVTSIKNNKGIQTGSHEEYALHALSEPISFDMPITNDVHTTYADIVSDPKYNQERDSCMESIHNNIVSAFDESLDINESSVMSKMFGLNDYKMSITDIKNELHTSKDYIRNIKRKAISKLRNSKRLKELNEITK